MLARFRRSVDRVFEQSMFSTRLQAFYTPLMGFLPNIGLAVVLLVGGRQVINGSLSLGEFTAFYTLPGDALRAGAVARDVAEHGPAGGRLRATACSRSSTASREMTSPPGAPPLPPGRRPGRSKA